MIRNIVSHQICIISLFAVIILGCEKTNDTQKRFPRTPEEFIESAKETQRIGEESSSIITDAMQKSISENTQMNLNEVAKKIEAIEGVLSAIPNETGSAIIVQQDDSVFTNILIAQSDEERIFKIEPNKSLNQNKAFENTKGPSSFPTGNKQALILAPFQHKFNSNLEELAGYLKSAGYEVDQALDSEARLDYFRGSFLNDYDVVFISTHGVAYGKTVDGRNTTLLLTGEEINDYRTNSLLLYERCSLSTGSPFLSNKTYYAITVPWLYSTTDTKFTNSWIYADACESAKVDEGLTSFSEAFLKLGAGGYNGFDGKIVGAVSEKIATKMFSEFSSGKSFTLSSQNVRTDPELASTVWTSLIEVPLIGTVAETFSVSTFDDNQLNTEPFYLFKPYLEIINNSTWDVTIFFNSSTSWHADVTFYSNGTTKYDEPSYPGLYLSYGKWSLSGNQIHWDIGPGSSYIFDGTIKDNSMSGTFVYVGETKTWSAIKK